MSAKELKILFELATYMGYTGNELKQFVAEQRKKIEVRRDRERERDRGRDRETERHRERQRETESKRMS